MYKLEAIAIRNGKKIEVTISGILADSCYSASIVDKYPDGNISYIKDPGEAQVFIEEKIKDNCVICKKPMIPWSESVAIKDEDHNIVSIFINNEKQLTVDVKGELPQFGVFDYGIISGCYIQPYDFPRPSPCIELFGPAAYESCVEWKKKNCNFNQ